MAVAIVETVTPPKIVLENRRADEYICTRFPVHTPEDVHDVVHHFAAPLKATIEHYAFSLEEAIAFQNQLRFRLNAHEETVRFQCALHEAFAQRRALAALYPHLSFTIRFPTTHGYVVL